MIVDIKIDSYRCKDQPVCYEGLALELFEYPPRKWLGQIPAIGVCTLCERRFTVPMTALTSEAEARKSLELQFVVHECEYNDESRRKAFAAA